MAAAVLLHALAVLWFQHSKRVIEVPFTSERFSTRVSMDEARQSFPVAETEPQPRKNQTPPKIEKRVEKIPRTHPPAPLRKQGPAVSEAPSAPQTAEAPSVPSNPSVAEAGTRSGLEGSPQRAKDDLQKYIRKVSRLIDSKKRYPRISQENGEEGIVSVQLVLGSSGELIRFTVLQRTEHERLHQAAVETIKAASPFPPLPESHRESQLVIQVPVRFRLNSG